ncbi:MAG: hypothetical protein AUJ89_03655 [Candidatus Omnitrophica bacterium CG1_02_43_210]|nr:MAG: hypothetical protein AUJ89_03655 [Candidatus Omnitrophica bacterium CG1_02_43_210]PIR65398.1 MAG: hypothetical protein COU52_04450 [Candidatus Omnitrophica bacterium CG10_big_fil_rev_8_21_14_0_10_43_8]PIV11835.1 MAG: hypothetical protein COS48_03865 [Candidatus Omnitrophica bacterium CG03_land_8_20_14_0_80_43_22]PJC45756.1 MAG: hypothetical protein CO036_06405 [Candidatus Omnitrophica bacterium CG_4_9_14_0_2_um_filter_43_12]
MDTKKIKAIAMLSGGLDSILAARLIKEQGIELEGLNFNTVFCTCTPKDSSCMASVSAAKQLGIPLKVINMSREYLGIVKNPKHGYGSNMNPCIDCRIFTFKLAAEYMKVTGAQFIVTGEVAGQRPMSQKKHTLRHIEKETGLEGLILRPLSAKALEPTIPEINGWVDRDKLLKIQGRGRKDQIQLAVDLSVKDYPCPSGGCLLTDPGFAKKAKDLIAHDEFTLDNINLIKSGRFFRLNDDLKAIAGRNQDENKRLLNIARQGDVIFKVLRHPGPVVLGRGSINAENTGILAGIAARYSDINNGSAAEVEYFVFPDGVKAVIKAEKSSSDLLEKIRV